MDWLILTLNSQLALHFKAHVIGEKSRELPDCINRTALLDCEHNEHSNQRIRPLSTKTWRGRNGSQ